MNELMIFEGYEIEIFEVNGQILFNAKNVAKCLDIKNVNDNIAKMNSNQVIKLTNSVIGKTDIRKLNNAGENFLTESGVYKLVFKSRKPDAEKFTDWIADEVLPSIRKTGTYTTDKTKSTTDEKSKLTEAKLINAKVRMSNQLLKLSYVDTLSTEYKNILVSKATEVLTGEQLIPLPKSKEKTYSATEIGEMFGVSKQKIGLLSNKFKLKTEQYGEWYRSKSEYSSKEVDTWVYYDSVIPVFKELLNVEVGAFA